jgi:ribose 5-phosphate isomerase B
MVIYLGADHRGFNLKESIKSWLKNQGYEVVDFGANVLNPEDDYTDFAIKVGEAIQKDYENGRGILICGSGAGVCITANKFKRVKAGLGFNPDQVFEMRNDDNINVLCLASDFIDEEQAKKIVKVFLITPFDHKENHLRRLQKIEELEDKFK